VFKKVITIADTDYNTLSVWWHDSLMKYHNVERGFPFWLLAEFSRENEMADSEAALEKCMTVERILSLAIKPLTPKEVTNFATPESFSLNLLIFSE
jgi:hypothetical protein